MISVSRLLIYAPGADSPSTAYPGVGLAGAGFQKPHIKSHGFSQCLTRFPGLWFGLQVFWGLEIVVMGAGMLVRRAT